MNSCAYGGPQAMQDSAKRRLYGHRTGAEGSASAASALRPAELQATGKPSAARAPPSGALVARALQKIPGIDQIGGREAFRERRIDGAQQFTRVLRATRLPLRAAQPDRGSQLRHPR